MAKRNRRSRAKNNVVPSSSEGVLIRAEADTFAESPRGTYQMAQRALVRSTLFSAELEEAIEIIARDRVYRAMLAAFRKRELLRFVDR
jgi:hypothetical protein